jgi:hypothetical protein
MDDIRLLVFKHASLNMFDLITDDSLQHIRGVIFYSASNQYAWMRFIHRKDICSDRYVCVVEYRIEFITSLADVKKTREPSSYRDVADAFLPLNNYSQKLVDWQYLDHSYGSCKS